jgi:diaminopimelate epimerase
VRSVDEPASDGPAGLENVEGRSVIFSLITKPPQALSYKSVHLSFFWFQKQELQVFQAESLRARDLGTANHRLPHHATVKLVPQKHLSLIPETYIQGTTSSINACGSGALGCQITSAAGDKIASGRCWVQGRGGSRDLHLLRLLLCTCCD